jgi:hypothetical protein
MIDPKLSITTMWSVGTYFAALIQLHIDDDEVVRRERLLKDRS